MSADTKTLLDATLESFLESKKEWVSRQSAFKSSINITSSLGENGGDYYPPADGYLEINLPTPEAAGNVYSQSGMLILHRIASGQRISIFALARKGGRMILSFPTTSDRKIAFYYLTGQS